MLRLMIVDDEYLFREALKISLPWEQIGYEVCCEAENGYDALEKIEEYRPDVALVDINMPVMDGLELAAEIKEKNLDVRVVIISGYGEFAYAKQAIQVGVLNYLLKPVEEEELIAALVSIRAAVEKQQHIHFQMESLLQQAREYQPILKEMLLNDLLHGNRAITQEEYAALRYSAGQTFDGGSFQVAVIELDEKPEYCWSGETRQAWCIAVSNIVADILMELDCAHEICRKVRGRLEILLFPQSSAQEQQLVLINALDRARQTVAKALGFTVTCGLGRPYEDIRQLAASHQEALYALDHRQAMGDNVVLPYTVMGDPQPYAAVYTVERKMQLYICLRTGDYDEAAKIVSSVFQEIRAANPSIERARLVCVELALPLWDKAIEQEGSANAREPGRFLQEVQGIKNLDELETWAMRPLAQLASADGTKAKRNTPAVETAKQYIAQNYTRFDLKIDEIARNAFVQYGYLCFLFKRETGKTINEYISDVRITRAKELIDGGCQSVSMLAARVGYADANYFSKCFKKLVGVTPGKYMEPSVMGKN